MKLPPFFALTAMAALAAASFISAGCENNSDVAGNGSNTTGLALVITPSAVHLDTHETTAVLRVEGGTAPFTWDVEVPDLGSVAETDGRIANYTRNGTAAGVQTLRVTEAGGSSAGAAIVQD